MKPENKEELKIEIVDEEDEFDYVSPPLLHLSLPLPLNPSSSIRKQPKYIDNTQIGQCCFCGDECNPCSQCCGRCSRAITNYNLFNGPFPAHLKS